MALEKYTLATVLINGGLLTEETEIAIDRDSRSQEMNTVAKQYAGESPGAGIMMVDVTNAVPSSDFELNPGQFFIGDQEPVELTVFAAGRTLTSKGFIIKDNFRHGVNTPAHLSMHGRFELKDWE